MAHEERQALIAQYKDGYEEVARSLEGFPEGQLSAHPLPGKWSAREIVQHLADSEMNSAIRLRKLLTEDRPQIQGYDQESYAARLRYNERDIAPALDAGAAGVPSSNFRTSSLPVSSRLLCGAPFIANIWRWRNPG